MKYFKIIIDWIFNKLFGSRREELKNDMSNLATSVESLNSMLDSLRQLETQYHRSILELKRRKYQLDAEIESLEINHSRLRSEIERLREDW